jgi:SAM-dependent MidA family methyltransferase
VRALAQRVATQGGAALIIDYGHVRTSVGETLQAVSRHAFADPWDEPGSRDLTAHVDFDALARAAGSEDVCLSGPVAQGDWLRAIGLDIRAAALANTAPERAEEVRAAADRLAAPGQMGDLFKVLVFSSAAWPRPEGFPE